MNYNGIHYQSVWADYQHKSIFIIDQTQLPFVFDVVELKDIDQIIDAIYTLKVRGAPAIGIAAAYAMWLSAENNYFKVEQIQSDYIKLISSRPTAVNLRRGADFVMNEISKPNICSSTVFSAALQFANIEINACKTIGEIGVQLIKSIFNSKNQTVKILTHCNAGWLACGDWGTALSPIFVAHRQGIPLKVFVDETRPLNQGARLTAWELHNENIEYEIIADNTGGLLMMNNQVDLVIVGADRIVANGDFANKIGTYLKALAAHEHNVPLVVAAPLSTFDFGIQSGKDIVIEQRNGNELANIKALHNGQIVDLRILPEDFRCLNYAFDITPAKFVDYYLTEIGLFADITQIIQKTKVL